MRRTSVLVPLFLAACHTAPTEDAAVIPWLDAGAPEVAAPEIPWLDAGAPEVARPNRACPAGWVEEPIEGGGHSCSPWATARQTCDATSAHFPGEPGCAPIGDACPSGDWPEDATDAWFVAIGGAGDGTRADPFGDLATAVAAASAGDTIVLGKGTFDAGVKVDKDLTIRGLCPSLTTLTRLDASPETAVLKLTTGNLTVSDLRIADTAATGVTATGGKLALEGVVIDHVSGNGVNASATQLVISDVRIHDVQPRTDDLTLGRGITMMDGSLTASRLDIDSSHHMGIWIEGTKRVPVTIEDFVVFGMQAQASDNNRGAAFRTAADGVATLRRVSVDGGYSYAIAGLLGDMVLEDVWINDVPDVLDGLVSPGAIPYTGTGSLTCAGITIRGVGTYGLRDGTGAPSGAFDCEDVTIEGTRLAAVAYPGAGAGIYASGPATTAIRRSYVANNAGTGVWVSSGAATIEDVSSLGNDVGLQTYNTPATIDRIIAEDNLSVQMRVSGGSVTTTDARFSAKNAPGAMGYVADASTNTLVRVLVDSASVAGISNAPYGAGLTLEDVVVRDMMAPPSVGFGVSVNASGPVTLTRVALSGAIGAAVSAADGRLDAEDLTIDGVTSERPGGSIGFGIDALGSDVTLSRVTIRDTQGAGLDCDDCSVTATDLLVSGVSPAACASGDCPDETAASGLYLGSSTTAGLDRTVIEGCEVGLQIDGSARLADVVLRNNTFGMDAVNGELDVSRVSYDGNETDTALAEQRVPIRSR